jgi:ATP-binding cassette subfamily F protein 3
MGEATAAHADSPFEFHFPEPPRASDPMLELRGATIGYAPDSPILNGVDLALRSGDRLALLGRNGAGKTTLLRALCGELPLLGGERLCVDSCRIAYFDQQQVDALDLEASALLHLQRLTPDAREQELRDFLGGFDFRGKRAEMPLAPFSGGEKARLALAIVVWQRPNVLVLDEPTNHLDLEMRRALEVALLDFTGATVLVSHDRHLLRSATDQLYRVADGNLSLFDGDLASYERELLRGLKPQETPVSPETPAPDKRYQRRAAAQARAERRPMEQALKRIEKELERGQASMVTIEEQLTDNGLYEESAKEALAALLKEQDSLRQRVETLEEQWLSQQETLEALPAG